MTAQPKPRMTYPEYLAHEKSAELKHEYLRGEVWAMVGGTPTHARIQQNISTALAMALKGRPCGVYSSDLRVRIEATDRSTYPDVTVICGKLQLAADDPDAVVNPLLVVEVLSDSTEASDRGEKFAHYRRLDSLQEYVLVSQHLRRVEIFRRGEGVSWTFIPVGEHEPIELTSLDVRLHLDDVYANPNA